MGRARGGAQVAGAARRAADQFASVFGEGRGVERTEITGDDALCFEVEDEGVGRYYLYAGGPLHREDGPAVIYADGVSYEYRLFGALHRADGPAVIRAGISSSLGSEVSEWYLDGQLHRTDGGPTVIYASGHRYWHQHGELHRIGAPAIVFAAGSAVVEEWYSHDRLHREDGPARINANGSLEWYFEGKRHREGGPAVIYPDGTLSSWYTHGKLDLDPTTGRLSTAGAWRDELKVSDGAR